MEDRNRVTVRILGTEYTIAGDASREHMMSVADYVDNKMHDLMAAAPNRGKGDIAVLTAINAADDYFNLLRDTDEMRTQNTQLRKDVEHFSQLWEDAKRNFIQYKEDNQATSSERMTLQRELVEKNTTIADLRGRVASLQEQLQAAQAKNQNLVQRLQDQEESKTSSAGEMKAMEEKCRELENNYFDLQMENIRLKGEVERYKKIVD
ncbi:MAG: cell division protein ZapA [Firmicutes bacterium]|nr:cell division protein ZapA [Bacillota bacterium]